MSNLWEKLITKVFVQADVSTDDNTMHQYKRELKIGWNYKIKPNACKLIACNYEPKTGEEKKKKEEGR